MWSLPSYVCAFFLAYLLQRRLRRRSNRPLPPGPRRFLGVLALPKKLEKEWEVYGRWNDRWGDITSVTALGQPIVVLGSYKVATEMLDKKSNIYSDRPIFQMAGELVGWSNGSALVGYSPRFQRARKYQHALFGTSAKIERFQPIQTEEYRRLLRFLLDSPEKFVSHLHFTTSAVILRIAYGYELKDESDPLLELVRNVMEEFSEAAVPGAFLVDLIPLLKYVPSWMPGAGFKRKAALWRRHVLDMIEISFRLVVDQMRDGTARDSFVSLALTMPNSSQAKDEIEDEIKWFAGTIYGGGTDTVITKKVQSRYGAVRPYYTGYGGALASPYAAIPGKGGSPVWCIWQYMVSGYHMCPYAPYADLCRHMMPHMVWAFFVMVISAMVRFFLQMVLHPEIQQRAQEELDLIVGKEHLPTFGDRPHLPYTNAICKEVYTIPPLDPTPKLTTRSRSSVSTRLAPWVSLIASWRTTFTMGTSFPKARRSSIILPNIWRMAHDPNTYQNPMTFNPERFLGPDAELDPSNMVFGFGRRTCPAKLLAEASLFITCASVLAAFDITRVGDADPVEEYLPGTISQLARFKCAIRPRSAEAEALVYLLLNHHLFVMSTHRKKRTGHPATFPIDQRPPPFRYFDPKRGLTPSYILAWRVSRLDLGLGMFGYRGIQTRYLEHWWAAVERDGIAELEVDPVILQNRVSSTDDEDAFYFIVSTNHSKNGLKLTRDSLAIKLAKDAFLHCYRPYDEERPHVGDPIWYRMGSFETVEVPPDAA
ncbi:Cytochrome P450 [Mycena kentingensis (nom. inval.)]|nr:Cytochrome P450 [Mycena kentingensis (nom. inval.)]